MPRAEYSRSQIRRAAAIVEGRELIEKIDFQSPATADLRLALEWIIHRMQTKREDKDLYRRLSTTTTNLRRLLLFLTAIQGAPFAQMTTDDLAEFLESYITAAAAKAQKSTIKMFDYWLREEKKDFFSKVNWKSGKLFIRDAATFYQLMTEPDFARLLASADDFPAEERQQLRASLLLLRRFGLRCGETVALSPDSPSPFVEELRLKIQSSKTQAGRRTLALEWLLVETKLDEIVAFIELRRAQNCARLFYDAEENPLAAARLGNLVRKAMLLADLDEQTAHSLRHCFANDLLTTYWLQVVQKFNRSDSLLPHKFDWARSALQNDFASGHVAPETVICFDDVRRLLGHADDKITLTRYIHITDLMTADAVRIAEIEGARKHLGVSSVARLAGTSLDAVRKKFSGTAFNQSGGAEAQISLDAVENWLQARLEKLTKAKS